MKRYVFGCCVLVCLLASCTGGKKNINPFETLTEQIDSLRVLPDSTASDTLPQTDDVIPATADESFADFFYNFASDEKFQRKRIVSPISSYKGDKVVRISREEWQYDPLFSKDQFYTVLYDREDDMEMGKDTAINSVQVDWIFLKERKVKRYYFQRIRSSWYLEAINKENLAHATEGKEDFFDFYTRFANDSIFQAERLRSPLSFVTADPDDEFQILETTLEDGQWFAFRPPLMKERLTNIHYGQRESSDSNTKIIDFKGFGNGFCNTLYFERKNGQWRLDKFEDLSD